MKPMIRDGFVWDQSSANCTFYQPLHALRIKKGNTDYMLPYHSSYFIYIVVDRFNIMVTFLS